MSWDKHLEATTLLHFELKLEENRQIIRKYCLVQNKVSCFYLKVHFCFKVILKFKKFESTQVFFPLRLIQLVWLVH